MNTLSLDFLTTHNLGSSNYSASAHRILSSWSASPERFDVSEPIRKQWDRRNPTSFIDAWDTQSNKGFGQVLIRRRKAPSYYAGPILLYGPIACCNTFLIYRLSLGVVRKASARAEFLSVADSLFVDLNMEYGRICTNEDYDQKNIMKNVPDSTGAIEPRKPVGIDWTKCLPGVYWLNYFGKKYVEWFGLDRFSRLPAPQVRRLGNGSICVTAYDDPEDAGSGAAVEAEDSIRQILGADRFFDKRDFDRKTTAPLHDFESIRPRKL